MTGETQHQQNGEQAEEQRVLEEVIEARLALLAAAYPTLVTEESRHMIRNEIGHSIARDNRLRRYRLGNGDEPMALFQPYRAAAPVSEHGLEGES